MTHNRCGETTKRQWDKSHETTLGQSDPNIVSSTLNHVGPTMRGVMTLWLCSLISEAFGTLKDTTVMFCDNQSAIALACDHWYHACTKHIDVRYHFIHWVVEQGVVRLVYCPTEDMVANILTKALPSPKVKHFTTSLGLHAKWGGVLRWSVCMRQDGLLVQQIPYDQFVLQYFSLNWSSYGNNLLMY